MNNSQSEHTCTDNMLKMTIFVSVVGCDATYQNSDWFLSFIWH